MNIVFSGILILNIIFSSSINAYEKLNLNIVYENQFQNDSYRKRNIEEPTLEEYDVPTEYTGPTPLIDCYFDYLDFRIETVFVFQPEYKDKVMNDFVSILLTRQLHTVTHVLNTVFPDSSLSIAFVDGSTSTCNRCPAIFKGISTEEAKTEDLSKKFVKRLEHFYNDKKKDQSQSTSPDSLNETPNSLNNTTNYLNNSTDSGSIIIPGSTLKTLSNCATAVKDIAGSSSAYHFESEKPVYKLLIFFTDDSVNTSQYTDLPSCFRTTVEKVQKSFTRTLLWYQGYVSPSVLPGWLDFKTYVDSKNHQNFTSGSITPIDSSVDIREVISNFTNSFKNTMCNEAFQKKKSGVLKKHAVLSSGRNISEYLEINGMFTPAVQTETYETTCEAYRKNKKIHITIFHPTMSSKLLKPKMEDSMERFITSFDISLGVKFKEHKITLLPMSKLFNFACNQCPTTTKTIRLTEGEPSQLHTVTSQFEMMKACANAIFDDPDLIQVIIMISFNAPEVINLNSYNSDITLCDPILPEELKNHLLQTRTYVYVYTTEAASEMWKDTIKRLKSSGYIIWNKYPSLARLDQFMDIIPKNLCIDRIA